ncbi:cell division protein SepF [Phormidium tenue FACHB-886]|nr:cell division protein SepF [Phormidium tenue FACHB-886]
MNFLQRLRDVLGIDETYEEYEEYEQETDDTYAEEEAPAPRSRSSNVIGLPGANGQMEMVMMQPRSFQEIPQAVNALRERKSVVLDLSLMDTDQAQRSADYVAGGAFAIDGHQRHLGACVFLFTPSFVQITNYQSANPPQPTQRVNPPQPTVPPPSPTAEIGTGF